MMIQPAHRHIYSMILLLIISFFASFFAGSRDLAFSGTEAVSTSKVVFYVY